jgi:hypothetical protein
MASVRARPHDPQSTHEISLTGGVGSRTWGIKLHKGAKGVTETPVTPSNIRATGGGSRYGDFDPSMSHIEIRDWSGGRGLEEHVDDPSRYYDSYNCFTMVPQRLFQTLQWHLSSGLRAEDNYLPGNVAWYPLIGDLRYAGVSFAPSTTYDADKALLLLRKVGQPAALTVQHRPTSGTVPDAATIDSSALGSSVVTDVVSQWVTFDWTGTTAQTSGVTYWLVAYASSDDNQANHWEWAYASTVTDGMAVSSAGAAWTLATGKPYFRVVSADVGRKWHMFHMASSQLYAVSQTDASTGTSQLYALTSGTNDWSLVATTAALAGRVVDVAMMSSVVLFARQSTAGGSTTIAYYRTAGSSDDLRVDSSNVADRLHAFYTPSSGPEIWRAVSSNGRISHAPFVAYGSSLAFTPSTGIKVGSSGEAFMDITDYNDEFWARKSNALYKVVNDRAARLPVGIDAVFETGEYGPLLPKDLYLYMQWSHSVQRLHGGTLDDLGPWKGAGMPSSRAGPPSCMESGVGVLYVGYDAGTTGVSSVMGWDGVGWHEIFRAPQAGMRVQNLKWDPHPGGSPRLWISCGGDLYYLTMPKNVVNPLRDPTITYQHEGVMEQAAIDMGVAQLPKLFAELHAITKNTNSSGTEVVVEYQLDEDVGSTSWTNAGRIVLSPADVAKIRRGDKHRIKLRFRLLTAIATTPTEVTAFILKAVARTPVKRQWRIRALTGTYQVTSLGLPDHAPDDFYTWFQDAAVTTVPLHMHSVWEALDDIWVYAEAPIVVRDYSTPDGAWGGLFDVTLKEF